MRRPLQPGRQVDHRTDCGEVTADLTDFADRDLARVDADANAHRLGFRLPEPGPDHLAALRRTARLRSARADEPPQCFRQSGERLETLTVPVPAS